MISGLACALLTLTLVRIVYTDVRYRTIGNIEVLAVSVCILIVHYHDVSHLPFKNAGLVLLIGGVIWHYGICGAGDIKLLAALSLGVGQQWFLLCLVSMLLLGGLLGISVWGLERLSQHKPLPSNGVPYAIPIVLSFGFGIYLTLLSS